MKRFISLLIFVTLVQPVVGVNARSVMANMPVSATSAKFVIDRPFDTSLCADMKSSFCRGPNMRSTLRLGYRLAPLDGIPLASNRNPNYWKKISERKKNEYLTITLWNFVTKLGVQGAKQYRTNAQILEDYKYIKSLTVWYKKEIERGMAIVKTLEYLQTSMRQDAYEEWLIDWFINGVIYVALPAIAPSLITRTDNSITYRN